MKKWVKNLIICMIAFVLGIGVTLGFLYGWSWLPRDGYKFNFDSIIGASGILFSLGAIIGVIWSTNRQIKNQNKESHRPYIAITGLPDITKQEDKLLRKEYCTCDKITTDKVIKNSVLKTTDGKRVLCISNIGYGVAHDVKIISLYNNKDAHYKVFKLAIDDALRDTIDVPNGESVELLLDITYSVNKLKQVGKPKAGKAAYVYDYNSKDFCDFAICYRGLNENMYCTIVSIMIDYSGSFTYTYYSEKTVKFNKKLEEYNIKYDHIKQNYIKNI